MMLRKVKLIDFVLCCKYSVRSGAGGPKRVSHLIGSFTRPLTRISFVFNDRESILCFQFMIPLQKCLSLFMATDCL